MKTCQDCTDRLETEVVYNSTVLEPGLIVCRRCFHVRYYTAMNARAKARRNAVEPKAKPVPQAKPLPTTVSWRAAPTSDPVMKLHPLVTPEIEATLKKLTPVTTTRVR